MTCLHPKWIYLRKYYPIEKPQFEETMHILNKPKWTYSKNRYAKLIPCHECLGCKLDHANEWAVRAYMEYKTNQIGCFITLTYNNGLCTIKGHENELSYTTNEKGRLILNKKDLQTFWKRLRKKYPDCKIKYMASGEYGTKGTLRPHYHAVVWGWKPLDLEYYKTNKNGDIVYKSKELQKIWGRGFVTVGELNYQTACYTARYTQKKITEELFKKDKIEYDIIFEKKYTIEQAEEIDKDIIKATYYPIQNKNTILTTFTKLNTKKKRIKQPEEMPKEYITSSQKIGLDYWLINKKLIKSQYGVNIVIKNKPKLAKIPKYFLKKWEEEDWEEYEREKYKNQLKGEKRYWQLIDTLKYPQDTPEWKKEIIFKLKQEDSLKHKSKLLHRDNINSKNYYST